MKKIFVTGASGCIGHYVVESLLNETDHYLYLLVRDPDKLNFEWENHPRVQVLVGNLENIDDHSDLLLKEINIAILAATSWGGSAEAYDVNVVKSLALLKMLNPNICDQVFYFSTASILDQNNELLEPALQFGTDYIRSKYQCFSQLDRLEISDRIIALFPTLVLGGDRTKPFSHLSAGFPEIMKWMGLIRWFSTEGSFHFIHAQDIARIITYLVVNPHTQLVSEEEQEQEASTITKLVLGNQAITVDQTIDQLCKSTHTKKYFSIPLYGWLINIFIKIFRIQMDSWSYFSLNYRNFTYQNTVTPAKFGLSNYVSTINEVLKTTGI